MRVDHLMSQLREHKEHKYLFDSQIITFVRYNVLVLLNRLSKKKVYGTTKATANTF